MPRLFKLMLLLIERNNSDSIRAKQSWAFIISMDSRKYSYSYTTGAPGAMPPPLDDLFGGIAPPP